MPRPLIAGLLPCFIVLTLCHLLVEDFCSYLQAAPLVRDLMLLICCVLSFVSFDFWGAWERGRYLLSAHGARSFLYWWDDYFLSLKKCFLLQCHYIALSVQCGADLSMLMDLHLFLTPHLLCGIRLSFWVRLLTSLCLFLIFFHVFLMLGTCTTAVAGHSGPWSAMNFNCSSKWYCASMCERDGRKPFPPSPSFLSSYSLCYIWHCHSLAACL